MDEATMNHPAPNRIDLQHRVRRHAAERGAAVFVVMLVITLLTALGIFAVRSSSLSTMASGFNRQLTQTHYVADYAVVSVVGDLGLNAQVHSTMMASGANDQCVGYTQMLASNGQPTCTQLGYNDLNKIVKANNPQNQLLQPPGGVYPVSVVPGSLGPAPLEGDMRVEVTDWHPAWPPLPGNDAVTNKLGYAMVTVSATGLVRPKQLVANQWDTASASAAGVESGRAHVVLGPVLMNN